MNPRIECWCGVFSHHFFYNTRTNESVAYCNKHGEGIQLEEFMKFPIAGWVKIPQNEYEAHKIIEG